MRKSPQADNWLRETHVATSSYNVAIVPSSLKDGYLHYFDNIIRKKNYRLFERRYRIDTLQRRFHPTRFNQLRMDQNSFYQKYPHTQGLFEGYQHVIVSKNNSRPFPRDFDEQIFLVDMENVMASPPNDSNGYATAIKFNIGNGVLTTLPILIFQVNTRLKPVVLNFD